MSCLLVWGYQGIGMSEFQHHHLCYGVTKALAYMVNLDIFLKDVVRDCKIQAELYILHPFVLKWSIKCYVIFMSTPHNLSKHNKLN